MKDSSKLDNAYKTIGEVAKSLNLIDKKTGSPQTHTLRYWETQFKQIRPTVRAGNRRYYSQKNIDTIKLIMNLLKNQGMTIKGVKRILENKKTNKLILTTLLRCRLLMRTAIGRVPRETSCVALLRAG